MEKFDFLFTAPRRKEVLGGSLGWVGFQFYRSIVQAKTEPLGEAPGCKANLK